LKQLHKANVRNVPYKTYRSLCIPISRLKKYLNKSKFTQEVEITVNLPSLFSVGQIEWE